MKLLQSINNFLLIIFGSIYLFPYTTACARPLDKDSVEASFSRLFGIGVAKFLPSGEIEHEPWSISIFLYIKNNTKSTLRISTKGYQLSKRITDTHIFIDMNWDFAAARFTSNEFLILPESRLEIVELRPGEETAIAFPIKEDPVLISKRLPHAIILNIPEKIWQRYNLDYPSFIIYEHERKRTSK